MRLPEMLMRVGLLAVLSMAICAASAADEQSARPKLKADLLHVRYPLQIEDFDRNVLGYPGSGMRIVKIAPHVKCTSTILREPTYDVSGSMTGHGLEMPPGSRAIFSPGAQLLFFESIASDVESLQTIVSPFPARVHGLLSMDLLLTLKSAAKTETLMDMKSMPFLSGQRLEFGAAADQRVRLIVEPVMGPDGEKMDFRFEVKMQKGRDSLNKEIHQLVSLSKPQEIEMGTLGGATVTLRLQTRRELDYFGPPVLETEAKKAAAIEEIQKAFRGNVAPALPAVKSSPEFVADLLHVTAPIQVTPDVHIASDGTSREEQGSLKATISPTVALQSMDLRGKVFDVSEALRQTGFTFPPGSRALYSPEAQLLYIHSIEDDVVKAAAMFYEEKRARELTMDVRATVKSGTREATLLEAKSVPLTEGRNVELNSSGQESLHLVIQPYVGTVLYDEFVEVGVDAEARAEGQSITADNTWLMHHAKPVVATLGKLGDATVTLSIQVHSHQGRWGDDAESEKEGKAAAIMEIRSALEKAAK